MFYAKNANPRIRELPIATGTVIEQGELVSFTVGTGVIAIAAPTDMDDPFLGIAAEPHDGATAGRQVGLLIKVLVPDERPLDIGWDCTNTLTATGGSTTTFVISGLVPQTNNIWKGGAIQVLTCAADSTMIGKRIPLTASTGSSGTLTFSTQTAAFASGDTCRLCPGDLAFTGHTWNLTSDGMNIDWDAAAVGEALMLYSADPTNMTVTFRQRLSLLADNARAI